MEINLLSKLFNQTKNPIILGFFFLILFLLTVAVTSVPAQTKLSLGDIFTGLRSKKVTLDERNRLLTDAIKSRGITFAITPDIEKELAETGGNKELIEAIKQKSIVVQPKSVPTPVATPAPTPASTPAPTPAPTPTQPDFASFQRKADSNFVKGEYDFAVINYTKAAELNPKEASIYLSRGLVYYNRKFFELAVGDYSKAIEIDPKEMMAYYYRGDSYEKLNEWQKAANDYKKVLELDPSNENVKSGLQRVEAELSKNKPQTVALKTEPVKTEPTKVEDKTEAAKVPEFAQLGSLVGFAIKLVQPNYPQSLRSMYIGGDVLVNVTIDEEGNPIEVKAASGPPGLRNASEEAVKKSKFKPAIINNQPVKAKGFITFKFKPF